jgi:hypothetical protein
VLNGRVSYFFRQITRKISREKVAVIGLWFLMLTGIRFLLAFALANMWIGTFGAVTITFALFCLIIKYTPLKSHAHAVNVILSGWYQRKYFLASAVATSAILASLLLLTQYGYSNYESKLVLLDVFNSDDRELDSALHPFENYPMLDKIAITAASTDKGLNGNYSRSTSFLLAEDLEMLSFVLVVRKKKNLFSE